MATADTMYDLNGDLVDRNASDPPDGARDRWEEWKAWHRARGYWVELAPRESTKGAT